jgi:hypothetical protein
MAAKNKKTALPLPMFGLRKHAVSTHELIFRILSRQFPLTVNALRAELTEKFRLKLSYQAVRKSVLTLKALGVVEHEAGGYRLSRDWLVQVRALADETLDRYRVSGRPAFEQKGVLQCYTARSLYEADTLWGDILLGICEKLPRKSRGRFVSINHYPWWLPLNAGRETDLFTKLQKLGFEVWFVFSMPGPASRWAASFYRSIGVHTHSAAGCGLAQTHYYNIIGDTLIEVVLPDALAKKIAKLFGRDFRPAIFEAEMMTKLAAAQAPVRLTVYENRAFGAGLLRMVNLG